MAKLGGMIREVIVWMRRLGLAVADLFCPRTCIVCGERLMLSERQICLRCMADMPLTRYWLMPLNPMARKLNEEELPQDSVAIQPGVRPELTLIFSYATALFFYNSENNYHKIPQSIKYRGNTDAGAYFGRMLGEKMSKAAQYKDVTAIIPVPLHPSRQRKRGYNQAQVIAEGIALGLGTRVEDKLLYRARRTQTQTKLSIEQKAQNVKKAFAVNRKRLTKFLSETPEALSPGKPLHLLLVDDVFTTGATLRACRSAIKKDFDTLGIPCRISGATLGCVKN